MEKGKVVLLNSYKEAVEKRKMEYFNLDDSCTVPLPDYKDVIRDMTQKIQSADPQVAESIMGQLLTLVNLCAFEMTDRDIHEAKEIARNFFIQSLKLLV